MKNQLLEKAFDVRLFEKHLLQIIPILKKHLFNTTKGKNDFTLNYTQPLDQLNFWEDYLEHGVPEEMLDEVFKRTTHTHHPKYVGHQVSAPAPITILTAMVSSLLNNGMAVYEMGMAPTAIEKVVVDILCKKIGYSDNFGGFLTSGGTLANLTALLSARKAMVKHDVWNHGHQDSLGVMVCEQAHYCIDRAAKIMGLGQKGIIKIPARNTFAMDIAQLEYGYQEAVQKGIHIFAIVGSAPSTATGAYDDLEAIANFARNKNIWFHVDGAHGGAAIFSDKYRFLLNGIAKADSVVIDGHKMMLMPTITTALLFKDKKRAQQTFSQKADYLLDDMEDDWINSGKRTFECTKTMMGMHWFILLKFYGEKLFDDFVTRQYDLARAFQKLLENHPQFELATPLMANIVCFRWVNGNFDQEELNRLNQTIRQHLLEDGEYYLVQTKLGDTNYLRTSLMNPFTELSHLEHLLGKIDAMAVKLTN
ncbi:L-2,4-diaminobutyrate decarboxylase [Croceitalea dokdonensis DOKDO 023]|uniref:L-2,4-diaminobutyrate decarboxylase n=1 Tax=Croceitalea dokdonensis DOKDO 023 TaxID=1300341 RepID=A0A0P7AHU8_9FLAO|nr:aminotransferase class I/II-fold pyridoxal phosphate-dependent enzyme [Croceitalea dokdonensis]KPM33157.1 L-2,4-diaminobutyrate decarboxylase [Croceitalea dokdonensis DOKDO 023]